MLKNFVNRIYFKKEGLYQFLGNEMRLDENDGYLLDQLTVSRINGSEFETLHMLHIVDTETDKTKSSFSIVSTYRLDDDIAKITEIEDVTL